MPKIVGIMLRLLIICTVFLLLPTQGMAQPEFSLDTYPRVDGSTATRPMALAIAKRLMGNASEEEIDNLIVHNTTHNAYVNLINGGTDLILVSRPSAEELELAQSKGVELDVRPMGRDAFVFVTHKSNPVKVLTTSEIQGIYTGNITNWAEVGGPDSEIVAFQRNPNSGSQTLMETLVMDGLTMMDPPSKNEPVYDSMGGLINTISTPLSFDNSAAAIGYTVYFYQNYMKPDENVSLFSVDGVSPNSETIADKSYPFTSEGVMVMRKDQPKDSNAYRLRQWLYTEAGQEAVAAGGFVSIYKRSEANIAVEQETLLHIPFIRYRNGVEEMLLNADLIMSIDDSGRLLFELENYEFMEEELAETDGECSLSRELLLQVPRLRFENHLYRAEFAFVDSMDMKTVFELKDYSMLVDETER